MHEHPDITHLMPPGTYLERLSHPDGNPSKMMELAIFKEHRFSFYFWNRWVQRMGRTEDRPTLVTLDWHRDFAPPSSTEKEALENLDLNNDDAVAKTSWSALDSHNDSHLLSAAYLNIIEDVFLLKNYGDEQHHTFYDRYEREHNIHEFISYKDFESAVINHESSSVILDIDLDFFVKGKTVSHQLKDVATYKEAEITDIINRESPLFRQLFTFLDGITIATEPRYCGGILKSNKILEIALGQLFTEELSWKHLL